MIRNEVCQSALVLHENVFHFSLTLDERLVFFFLDERLAFFFLGGTRD